MKRMNRRGNIIINLMFFMMGLAVVVMFISPIRQFIDIAQESGNLNCKGYIYDGNANHELSFNASKNNNASSSPLSCLGIKLYLPFVLMAFLIGGVVKLLYDRTSDAIGGPSGEEY